MGAVLLASLWAGPLVAGAVLPPGGSFVDDDGSVHEGANEALLAAGITRGCAPDRFCADDDVTRAELIALVSRGLDLPDGPDAFSDDDGHTLEVEINAAAAAGITTGCREGAFCPSDPITRSQSAAMLVRAFGYPPTETDFFGDDQGDFFEAEINALAEAGITLGCADGEYCPLRTLTRAETASLLVRALGLEPIEVPSRYPTACDTAVGDAAAPGFAVVPGDLGPLPSGGTEYRYMVEVQNGLAIDHECLAAAVDGILQDAALGWGAVGTRSFHRVESGDVDFRVTLATPGTVDAYCLPLNTGGIFSCWNGSRAMINLTRWRTGADSYGSHVDRYRAYLINHEVGHAIGFSHRSCPSAGEPAPVMVQQTKSLFGCAPNPWPTENELASPS